MNARDIHISDVRGHGVRIDSFEGTANFSNLSIANAEIAAMLISSRSPRFPPAVINVDEASRISQDSGRFALWLSGYTGTLNFAGAIESAGGEGIRFESSVGAANFTGDVRLGTSVNRLAPGASAVDILGSNADQIRFSNLTAFTNGGPALRVTNSSNVSIASGAFDVLNANGIDLDNADNFSLNNTTITTPAGFFTINVSDSQNLSGSGNAAIPGLNCNDGGSNSGTISFGSQGTCP